jgi:hypothetical protein
VEVQYFVSDANEQRQSSDLSCRKFYISGKERKKIAAYYRTGILKLLINSLSK